MLVLEYVLMRENLLLLVIISTLTTLPEKIKWCFKATASSTDISTCISTVLVEDALIKRWGHARELVVSLRSGSSLVIMGEIDIIDVGQAWRSSLFKFDDRQFHVVIILIFIDHLVSN